MSFKGRQEIPQDEVAEADDDEWVSAFFFGKQDVVIWQQGMLRWWLEAWLDQTSTQLWWQFKSLIIYKIAF